MLMLKDVAQTEFVIKNSRFLSEATPVTDAQGARDIWQQKKKFYDNGGHIVYAFVTGTSGSIMGCSDDGEPAGTAGRPMLNVLKNSGITNLVITVARWYGGIKLGTGGLVHAYTQCAQTVLSEAITVELAATISLKMVIPYSCYELINRFLKELKFEKEREDFTQSVTIFGQILESQQQELELGLNNLTGGKVQIVVLSS